MSTSDITAFNDQQDTMVASIIREHGVFIQAVRGGWCSGCGDYCPDDSTPFAYTVGLFGMGHPELLIFSVDDGTASGVLNDLADRVRAGENLIAGQLITFDGWPHRITTEDLPNPGEIVFAANRHYDRPPEVSVPVLQLTYDDRQGRFPWDDGYANEPRIQPRPGTFRA